MARPIYETEQDRQNERALADAIEARFKCKLTKMSMKYHLDFIAERDGKAVAFFEMRQRKNKMMAYSDYMLSLDKVRNADTLTAATGLPCYLVVKWADAVGYCEIPPSDSHVAVGGSYRRNDPQDIEPMVFFPVAQFKVIDI